ncbi:AraC family transcriptional regulator [Hafnia paralvei]|nr:AraC family transcriptional regulator [Hafnia paralvei]RDA63057.1 AraC family transcriptional regulator [Hafnia paralvei]RDA63897.1 AraC family transcriptional regulator [Hafnia paralvei]RDA75183.1 AraC family transcriptional regulator [Hafnia paralvei]RDA75589.1 AraC family transcriptional regulator [Hafnia paralvei]
MSLNNVRTYHGLLCFTEEERVDITIGNNLINIPKNSFIFIEKNINLKIRLHNGKCPSIVYLDDEYIKKIHDILLLSIDYKAMNYSPPSPIYIRNANDEDIVLFKKIKKYLSEPEDNDKNITQFAIITYLIIQFGSNIIKSISKMLKPKTKDKVLKIISADISKQWTLSKVSEIMCMSEISLRKKLDSDGEKFMQILTDLRMNYGMRLLLTTEYTIEKLASSVGYNTTSYFIKIFKDYFGLTPKQVALNIDRDFSSVFSILQSDCSLK